VKSQETVAEDKWAVHEKSYGAFTYEEFLQFRRFGSTVGKGMETSAYWNLYERAERQILGEQFGFRAYYRNFVETMRLSEVYSLGFYRSEKDGIYRRFTREQITQHMQDYFDAALRNARRW